MVRLPEEMDKDIWDAQLLAPLQAANGSAVRATPTAVEVEQEMEDFGALYAAVSGGKRS